MGYSRDPLDGRDDVARGDRLGDEHSDSRDVSSSSSVQHAGLRALSDLDDLGIAEGEPDIRGWTVRTADGVHVGEVDDLIIDTLAMKVRYMCVELDGATFDLDDKRRVLVPLGTARLDDVNDDVSSCRMPRNSWRCLPTTMTRSRRGTAGTRTSCSVVPG